MTPTWTALFDPAVTAWLRSTAPVGSPADLALIRAAWVALRGEGE